MDTVPNPTSPEPKSIWDKGIPRTNWGFMIISLVLVFGLDLLILISSPSLAPFWIEMLIVIGIFAIFLYLENYVFSKKFSSTKSAVDPWISAIIVARNFVFFLNFIPLIQILGAALLIGFLAFIPPVLVGGLNASGGILDSGMGGLILLMPALFVLYVILIVYRFSAAKQQPATT